MASPVCAALLALVCGAPSPLIGRIFARSHAEIQRAYPSCAVQSAVPLALRCPLTLYGVGNSTVFLFDEVQRVNGVVVEFAPQTDLDRLQKWLKPLLNDLADQFGMPNRPKPVHGTVIWKWTHDRAVVEVTLQKAQAEKWHVTVVFAEARPPKAGEVPRPGAPARPGK